MGELDGRVMLVTGAGGHVGRALVQRLEGEGARVAGLYHRTSGEQPASLVLTADLTQEAPVEAAFDEAERRLGELWGVFHIAGGWKGGQRLAETGLELFEELLSTNLRSAFLVSRAAMRRLQGRGGRIVLVGSYSAATSTHLTGSGAYNVSKAGVIALTKALAEEGAAAGVYANCLAPGTIATEANRAAMPRADASRWVPVEEVVEAALAAVSPKSGLNGAVLTLGGRG